MGIGLSEYRAALGAFAKIAVNAGLRWKNKPKQHRSSRQGKVGGEERCEKVHSDQSKKRCISLDRWKTGSKSIYDGQRSKTLSQREHRDRSRQQRVFRLRSRSNLKRKKKTVGTTGDTFKTSCITCKTVLFKQKWQRGRARHRIRHCSHDLSKGTVVQMLLVRSGIETNPGPTTPTSSSCCNARQHFNRVKNIIEEKHKSFQSKVTQDTLTKKILGIEETGNYFALSAIISAKYLLKYGHVIKHILK